MKLTQRNRTGILGLATVILSAVIVLLFSSSALSGALTQSADCAPTPFYVYDDLSTGTPTPDASLPVTSNADIAVSVTPLFISKNTFDLAPDVAMRDKYAIIVFRCEGTFDTYLVAAGQSTEAVKLAAGDMIWDVQPSGSVVGNQIPDATPMPVTTMMAPEGTDAPIGYPDNDTAAGDPYP